MRRRWAVLAFSLLVPFACLPGSEFSNGPVAVSPEAGVAETSVVEAGSEAGPADAAAPADAADGGLRCNFSSASIGPRSGARGSSEPQLEVPPPGSATAPSVMKDGPTFRMWFTADGAVVHYAESASADGPWHTPGSTTANTTEVALDSASGVFDSFPQNPSVIRVDGAWYMYYFGVAGTGSVAKIGLATSSSGRVWTRHGPPILAPLPSAPDPAAGLYSVSAFWEKGLFYLLFTDPNAPGTKTLPDGSTAGEFLIRSPSAAFDTSVQSFTATGWVDGDVRSYPIVDANLAQIALCPELGRYLVVTAQSLYLVDPTNPTVLPGVGVDDPAGHSSSAGIFRAPEGTVFLNEDCVSLSMDFERNVLHADGGGNPASSLAHFGFDALVK